MNIMEQIRPKIAGLQKTGLLAGTAGILISLVGAFINPDHDQFFRSWLFAFLFWLGLSMGSLAWLMVHHTTGGGWGFIIRRMLEAATRVLPLMIVFFVPLLVPMLLGQKTLYPWVNADPSDEVLRAKAIWLNVPGFLIRSAIYFAVWIALAAYFNKGSKQQDQTGDKSLTHKMTLMGPRGLILYVVTITFAAIDWVMSMNPHWYSSMFGALFVVGQTLAAISFMNIMVAYFTKGTTLLTAVPRKYLGDLGNFNMAFTLLWAYVNYSQWLIMYHANIAEESTWFLERSRNGWQFMAGALIVFHFIVPFGTLAIATNIKREPHRLWKISFLILFMRAVDLFWFTQPSHRVNLSVHFLDIAAFVGIGGLWLWFFATELGKEKNYVPLHDPRIHGEWPPHAAHDRDKAGPREQRGGEEGGFEAHAGIENTNIAPGGSGSGVAAHG